MSFETNPSGLRPAFMVRVAGLPVESVHALRCPDSRRWADEVLDESAQLTLVAEKAGDRLHDLIGGSDDEPLRRALLKLRRDIFNNRLPAADAADALLARVRALDPAAAATLTDWLTGRRALDERRGAGAALLAAETGRSRAALRELAGHERLRRALLLASPALDAQLDAYRRTAPADGARPGKKERKIERSLLSYVYRTACKTSPFSTFTGVALGTLTGSDGLRLRVDEEWRAQARLNVVALGRLADAVIADPARRADLPVAPASGWGRDDDRVRYVRRWVTAGDDDTAVTFDAVKDRLFFLRRSGTLDRLLGLFEERRGSVLRYGELVEWLARDRGAAREECEQYLGALLDVGMVQVPCLRTEVHDTDPLRAFQGALGGLERPWADRLADRLEGPARCVERFADASLEERRVLLDTLRAQLRAVQEEELGAERAKVPQTLLYEDAAAGGSGGSGGASAGVRTELDPAAWAELAAGPLAAVERVLPAFDLTLPQRITFEGFFLARYGHGGRCDDLLKLVHDFHEDFFRPVHDVHRHPHPVRCRRHLRPRGQLAGPGPAACTGHGPAHLHRPDDRAVGGGRAGGGRGAGGRRIPGRDRRATRRTGTGLRADEPPPSDRRPPRRPARRPQPVLRGRLVPLQPVHPALRRARRAAPGRRGGPWCPRGPSWPRSPAARSPATSTCTAGSSRTRSSALANAAPWKPSSGSPWTTSSWSTTPRTTGWSCARPGWAVR